jgi:hypothetical protein
LVGTVKEGRARIAHDGDAMLVIPPRPIRTPPRALVPLDVVRL